jgi:hypothetical protein
MARYPRGVNRPPAADKDPGPASAAFWTGKPGTAAGGRAAAHPRACQRVARKEADGRPANPARGSTGRPPGTREGTATPKTVAMR